MCHAVQLDRSLGRVDEGGQRCRHEGGGESHDNHGSHHVLQAPSHIQIHEDSYALKEKHSHYSGAKTTSDRGQATIKSQSFNVG